MQRNLWGVLVVLLCSTPPAVAQNAGGRFDSRVQLEMRRDSLEQRLVQLGNADDEELRAVERQLAGIEQRLSRGDFQPGEVVGLEVRGQPQWSGSFTILTDRTLSLPGVPPIAMDGVLYAEADSVITEGLATVLREPEVEIDTQMRVGVTGEVGAPGYYDVSGSMLVSDVLMLAGGPTTRAKNDKIRVRRFGETVLEGPQLTAPGLTLDDLGIQSGDAIDMPSQEGQYLLLRNIGITLGIVASSVALIALVF